MRKIIPSIKRTFVKVFLLMACLGLILPGTALATPANDDKVTIQILSAEDNGAALEIQKSVDKYVFETHAKDIEKKGFSVTYTSPAKGYVEIGIMPFNQENADYLYGVFGKDKIKVVEGQQIAMFSGEAKTTSAPVEKTESGSSSALIYTAAAVVLLGGALFIICKQKSSR